MIVCARNLCRAGRGVPEPALGSSPRLASDDDGPLIGIQRH